MQLQDHERGRLVMASRPLFYLTAIEASDEDSIYKRLQTGWSYNSDGSRNAPTSLLASGILGQYDGIGNVAAINSTIES